MLLCVYLAIGPYKVVNSSGQNYAVFPLQSDTVVFAWDNGTEYGVNLEYITLCH